MTSRHGSAAEPLSWRPRHAAVAVAVGIAASVLMVTLLGGNPGSRQLFGLVVPAQSLATVLTIWWLARRRPDSLRVLSISIAPKDVGAVLIGAGLQIGLSLVAYWVTVVLFGGEAPTQQVVEAAGAAARGGDLLLVVVVVVLLVPISEELAFRGVLLGALRRTRSDRFSVVVSAAAFSGLHLLDPNALLAVPFLFVVGVVMARSVVTSGRLGRAVAIHAGFNGVTVLVLLAG